MLPEAGWAHVHRRSRFVQPAGDGVTDSFRAAGDERTKSFKFANVRRHQPISSDAILSPSSRKM